MPIANAVVKFGTEAVVCYREVAGIPEDSDVPEIFIGSFIVPRIYDTLKLCSRVEQPYLRTAKDSGVEQAIEVAKREWNGNADVTVYRDNKPSAIIELKKFTDGQNVNVVVSDRDKLSKFAPLCGIEAYLGVYVTDDDRGPKAAQRISELNVALGHKPFAEGNPVASKNGKWYWSFVVWKLPI